MITSLLTLFEGQLFALSSIFPNCTWIENNFTSDCFNVSFGIGYATLMQSSTNTTVVSTGDATGLVSTTTVRTTDATGLVTDVQTTGAATTTGLFQSTTGILVNVTGEMTDRTSSGVLLFNYLPSLFVFLSLTYLH